MKLQVLFNEIREIYPFLPVGWMCLFIPAIILLYSMGYLIALTNIDV